MAKPARTCSENLNPSPNHMREVFPIDLGKTTGEKPPPLSPKSTPADIRSYFLIRG
jgi:hypothetical protein